MPSDCRVRTRIALLSACAAFAFAVSAAPAQLATAQPLVNQTGSASAEPATIYIGGSGHSSVEVNLEALDDESGPPSPATLPRAVDLSGSGKSLRNPIGAALLTPPLETPVSRLLIEPEGEAAVHEAASDDAPTVSSEARSAPRSVPAPRRVPLPVMPESTGAPIPLVPPPAAKPVDLERLAEAPETEAEAQAEMAAKTSGAAEAPSETTVAESSPASEEPLAATRKRVPEGVLLASFEGGAEDPATGTEAAKGTNSEPELEPDLALERDPEGEAADGPAASPAEGPALAALPDPSGGEASSQRILFSSGSELTAAARGQLDSLAQAMKEKPDLRVQLVAYADDAEITRGEARRLSLSRALAIRSYLIEQDLRSTRMDVRALGAREGVEGPLDRVDIEPAGN